MKKLQFEEEMDIIIDNLASKNKITCKGRIITEFIPKDQTIQLHICNDSWDNPHIFDVSETYKEHINNEILQVYEIIKPKPTFGGMNPPPPLTSGKWPVKLFFLND